MEKLLAAESSEHCQCELPSPVMYDSFAGTEDMAVASLPPQVLDSLCIDFGGAIKAHMRRRCGLFPRRLSKRKTLSFEAMVSDDIRNSDLYWWAGGGQVFHNGRQRGKREKSSRTRAPSEFLVVLV